MDRFTRPLFHLSASSCCAQRLSASWIVSLYANSSRTTASASAQRLSASWIVSHGSSRLPRRRSRVLNACRRHGSFHTGPRFWHDVFPLCSTPVGVMDRFTRVEWDRSGRALVVLNACRRHGSFHPRQPSRSEIVLWCSTPVGVMDRFTRRRVLPCPLAYSCSTPVGVMDRFTARVANHCSTYPYHTSFQASTGFEKTARFCAISQLTNIAQNHGFSSIFA